MAWNILTKLGIDSVSEIAGHVGNAAGSIMDRVGFTKKLSEADRIDKILKGFSISANSTDSARQLAMVELRTQKQPWINRFLNGFIRPFGGLGALSTEFYAMWAENLSVWFNFEYRSVNISVEQHFMLGSIIMFYFGSRLKETLTGNSSKR